VLEAWDFAADLGGLEHAVERAVAGEGLRGSDGKEVARGAIETLRGFLGSPLAREVARWRILARELPLLVEGEEGFVHAIADLVAEEEDGTLLVVDWKTDAVGPADAPERARRYAAPTGAYARALRSALPGRAVRALLVFLRPRVALPLPV